MHIKLVNYSTVPFPVFADAKNYSFLRFAIHPIPPGTNLSTDMVRVSWGLR